MDKFTRQMEEIKTLVREQNLLLKKDLPKEEKEQ